MRPGRRRTWWIVALLPSLLLPAAAAEESVEAKRHRLEALQQRIEKLEETSAADRGQRGELQRELEQSERRAGELSRALRAIEQDLEERSRALEKLGGELQRKERELGRNRAELRRQLRGAFILGRQKRLKLLLNQEDPGRVSRITAYYEYLSRSRAQRIEEIRIWVRELRVVAAAVAAERAQLARLRGEREAERQRLEQSRNQRQAVLAQLERSMQEKESSLRELKKDAKALGQLLERLALEAEQAREQEAQRATAARQAAEQVPEREQAQQQRQAQRRKQPEQERQAQPQRQSDQPLAARKGRLPWPAAGRLSAGYGSRRAAGGLTWDGVVISAPEGSEIRAVHPGRVVYADWLRGFGLLLILDHGDGYMTLYGFNQTLLKQTGEQVAEGEPIALVGDSGGRRSFGLYFGIRHQGRPDNPRRWCRKLRGGKTG